MAANEALLASLLLGQRQRPDPLDTYRKYSQPLIQQGTSTAPLGSGNPLEGVARALQGGLGGLMAGYANQKQEEQDKGNIEALTAATTATTPEDIARALKGLKGNSEMVIPVLGQIIQSRLDQSIAQQKAGNMLPQYGMSPSAGGTTGLTPPTSGSISTAPLPAGAAPPSPEGFANNSGNIRASNANWTGKGQPLNGFETFDTPQSGANAHFQNFQAYVKANPNITVAQALAQWSPSKENNTQGIISQIAEGTGINPGMPLADALRDPAMAAQLLDAQTRLEKGGLPKGFTADTFMTATGGQPAAPQVGANVPAPQMAPQPQAAPPQAVPQQGSPAGNQLRQQAMNAKQMGDNVTALKFAQQATEEDAKWATKIGEKTFEQNLGQPQQTIGNEANLRGQFDNLQPVKDYRKAATIFDNAVKSYKTNTAAADLNLVYSFATMMDPGSVVREGEMGMVKATQNASDQVKALVAAVSGGGRISPEARENLMAQMANRYGSYKQVHDQLAETFGGIADRSGMNRQNIVAPLPEVKYEAPQPKKGSAASPTPPQPAVDRLRANPGEAAQFDEIFGPGAAARVLGR